MVGAPPEPSAQEKDQIAEEAEFEFAEQNPVTAAIALMLADMRRAANPGLSRAAALAQTRAAFRAAFRDVLDRTGP
ncbi:MAG: hypothetical protein LPK88_09045 [Alphaproteobacteria bacterium]|nr:hypothetical protein [Alphaproteobacteria bacterium]